MNDRHERHTGRKKTEEGPGENSEKFRNLFDSMPEGFAYCRMLYDREGKPVDWVYISVNPAFEEITGLKNITGMKVTSAIRGIMEGYPELFEIYGRVAETGIPEKFEIDFAPVSKKLRISVYSPEKEYFAVVFEDITRLGIAEEEQKKIRSWQAGVNRILGSVLSPAPLDRKLKIITDGVVETFGAEFCRIWLIEEGDLCEKGCIHAGITEGPYACRSHEKCLHLEASSGRYTRINGKLHRRIPLGSYKVGQIASGDEISFLTNDVQNDPQIEDHEWAGKLGLVSFAGYRLKPRDSEVMGVFALFAKFEISPDMDAILKGLSRAIALLIKKEIAEETVRKSRDYFLKLFDDFPNPIWRAGTDAKCNYFNKEWLAFTGRTAEQEMGDGWTEGIHPDDLDRCVEIYTSSFQARKPFEMEYRLRYNDGSYHWLFDSGKPFYDLNGSFAGYIGSCYDINERKLAEEAIRTSVELNHLIDTMSVADSMKYTLDVAERLTDSRIGFFHFVNPGEETIRPVTWSTGTLKICNVTNGPETEYPLSESGVWVDALRERKPVIHNDYESLPKKKGLPGGHVPVTRELVVPIFDENRIVAVIGVGNKATNYDDQDTSVLSLLAKNVWMLIRRKNDEDALRESEQKFRDIFENANDAIEIIAIGENGSPANYIDINDVACRMSGYTKEELLKIGPIKLSTGKFNRPFEEIMTELHSAGHVRFETEHYRKDGTAIPLEINSHIVTLTGKKVILAVTRDITERKRAEEAVKEANNKLNMLSSITRHDILNMIMVINGYLDLSKELETDPSLQEYILKEKDAVDAIQHQIEFTRYYQDIGVEEPGWQDAGEIVGEAERQLDMDGIAVDNSLKGLEIFADPLAGKVFYNLMENSLRHGEHITSIGLSYSETADGVTISYRDNGVGISEEDKKKLFTRGFGKNTGLGLFLSREILSITGITIEENGEPGKGVNFEIKVPGGKFRIKSS
ncbi:PAS domain S-box protein [Methanolacinia paynteri]|uniref:PAS domain S-box protein n=1 Tax=Methanolacinia paynteri TaxID=230356 RepID=UPI000694FD77|nr:PAS domain S-box protein [Methanolacinia paynteri]